MSKQLLLLLILVCLTASSFASSKEQYRQIRLSCDTPAELDRLRQSGLDIVWRGEGYVEVVVNEAEFALLQSEGIAGEIVHESVTDFYRERLLAEKDMGGYKTLSEIYAYLDGIIADHPEIVSPRQSIGQTIEGRDMWAVKISDNPELDEAEPEVLLTSAIHAREVITPEALLYFMDHVTDNYGLDPAIADLVNNREIWLVLVCNPDGYYYNEVDEPLGGGQWRKNRRDNNDGSFGVDLNRNFAYRWGYDNYGSSPTPYSSTYRGLAPFSEPETQNLRSFAIEREFVVSAYLHAYSNLIIWPWGYRTMYTEDEDIFAAMGDSMSAYNGYVAGPISIAIYEANGGSDDWYYGEQRVKNKTIAFTFEIGGDEDGFWPAPSRVPQLVQENLQPLLFLVRAADRMYSIREPRPPVVVVDSQPVVEDYTVYWSHTDSLNPAVEYDLLELQGPVLEIDSASGLEGWQQSGFSLSTVQSSSSPSSFHASSSNGRTQYLQTPHPLAVQAGDTLRFQTRYNLRTDCEYGYVEVSTDGLEFQPIEGNITTVADPNGLSRGHGITGSTDWTLAKFDLAAYEGREILIRFAYESCALSNSEGIYIDDIYPRPGFSDTLLLATALTDTSYEMTGRPSGFYWYQVRSRDAEGQQSLLSAAARTEAGYIPPCCAGTTGDLNCGQDGVDISDVQILIDHLFLELTPLCCETSANLNYPGAGMTSWDDLVDITDLSILIDNQFLTLSPLPPCP